MHNRTIQHHRQQPVLFTFPKVACATVIRKTEAFHHFFKIQPISQVFVDVQINVPYHVKGQRGISSFWIHCKHLFCTKNINSAQNGPTKLGFSDESSLFTVLWGPFLGQRMFFEQNKCLQWIQNHNKPLVWPLTCYLEHIYFGVFSSCMVKSMGHKLSSWKWRLSGRLILVDF